MSHTVALLGPNGNVGAATLKHLLEASKAGAIKVVVLHRPGSPPKDLLEGANVDIRVIDLEAGEESKILQALKGIQVLISTIAPHSVSLQVPLVKALAKVAGFKVFIPSKFGLVRTPEEEAEPHAAPFAQMLNAASNTARELGVGVTEVATGVFDLHFFAYCFLRADVKNNKLQANAAQMKKGVPITSLNYLGAALATIASRDPDSIANRNFSAVEFMPSGQELVDLFTKINGKPTEIADFTQADYQALANDTEPLGPVAAGYFKYWEENLWRYENPIQVHGMQNQSLEEVVRKFSS